MGKWTLLNFNLEVEQTFSKQKALTSTVLSKYQKYFGKGVKLFKLDNNNPMIKKVAEKSNNQYYLVIVGNNKVGYAAYERS